MTFETEEVGVKETNSYRIFFKRNIDGVKHYVSPFHDISLFTNLPGVFRMVVEIPRWSNAKLEICKSEPFNPIRQDIKMSKLRFVDNCFPYHGYIWNYGALPQTWEQPGFLHPGVNFKGDNDPIDVIEIGSKIHLPGSVIEVKVLGALALIDEDELDWKIIAIDINDTLAGKLNDLSDLKIYTPGLLKATLDWFRIYKIPNGSKPNKFAFNEQLQDRESAIHVINLGHELWKGLILNESNEDENNIKNFKLLNTDLNYINIHTKTHIEAYEIVKNFIEKLESNVVFDKESKIKNEKFFYINKREIAKQLRSQEVTGVHKECKIDVFMQITNFINTNPLIIPIFIAFLGYILYSFFI